MKQNRTAVIIVLFFVFSHPIFSDEESCEQTEEFKLGETIGKIESYPSKKSPFWLGFSLPVIGTLIGSATVWIGCDNWCVYGYRSLVGFGLGMLVALFTPVWLESRPPKTIPEHISEEQLDCYSKGYTKAAWERDYNGILRGSLWGGSVTLIVGFVVTLFYCPSVPTIPFRLGW